MTEAIDDLYVASSGYPEGLLAGAGQEEWPKPDLRLTPPLSDEPPLPPSQLSDEEFIKELVAEGHIVISYKTAHRLPSGQPRRFYPRYPL